VKLDNVESSYKENGLGQVLYDTVIKYRPVNIVEFGVYQGYSTIYMASALQDLGGGHIIAYDLWEDYDYRHTTMERTQANIDDNNLSRYVTLAHGDFDSWLDNPPKFDMLHLDISNDGDKIEKALTKLAPLIETGSIVVFEGGSAERDSVSWMKEFNKRPMNPLAEEFGFTVLDERFPSISIVA